MQGPIDLKDPFWTNEGFNLLMGNRLFVLLHSHLLWSFIMIFLRYLGPISVIQLYIMTAILKKILSSILSQCSSLRRGVTLSCLEQLKIILAVIFSICWGFQGYMMMCLIAGCCSNQVLKVQVLVLELVLPQWSVYFI